MHGRSQLFALKISNSDYESLASEVTCKDQNKSQINYFEDEFEVFF